MFTALPPDHTHPNKDLLMDETEPAAVTSWSEKDMKPRQLLVGKAVQKETRMQVGFCAQNAQHAS